MIRDKDGNLTSELGKQLQATKLIALGYQILDLLQDFEVTHTGPGFIQALAGSQPSGLEGVDETGAQEMDHET